MELNLHCVLARSEERPNIWQHLRQVWTQTSSHISLNWHGPVTRSLSLYTRRVMSYYLLQYISLSRKSVESKRQSSSIELLINNIFRIPYVIIRDLINKHLATLIPTLRGTRRSKLKWRSSILKNLKKATIVVVKIILIVIQKAILTTINKYIEKFQK